MYRTLFFLIIYCGIGVSIFAQTLSEKYEFFQQKAKLEYKNYRDTINQEYANFVRQVWQQYEMLPAIPNPKDELPVFPLVHPEQEGETIIKDRIVLYDEVMPIIQIESQPVPVTPIKEQSQPQVQYFEFVFWGTMAKIRLGDRQRFRLSGCSENDIADGWQLLAKSELDNLIRDCLELRIHYRLCDWAYLCMLKKLSEDFLGKETNESSLLLAYLYCQSGYQMRMGQANGRIYMLYASKHSIYDQAYFKIDGMNYYPLDCREEKIYISQATYPNEQLLSLQIKESPKLVWNRVSKRCLQANKYQDMKVEVSVNKNLIDFFNTYPASELDNNFMTRWSFYANTPMSDDVKEELYPLLKKQIMTVSHKKIVEQLLNWVQTAFVYEYDDKVWGKDRAFFPEETLYYPYSDCEDRAILFTRLVRDLLGLECLLVYYPGHLASAVCFNEETNGDYIVLNGKRYIICDPTYINAPVGVTMPNMDNKIAKVILLQ